MHSKGLVDGLEITDKHINRKCEDCIRGKTTANPHTQHIAHMNDNNDGLVCVDLWSPSSVRSTGGALYFMPVINTENRIREVYFSSNKEAATTSV